MSANDYFFGGGTETEFREEKRTRVKISPDGEMAIHKNMVDGYEFTVLSAVQKLGICTKDQVAKFLNEDDTAKVKYYLNELYNNSLIMKM